MLQMYLRSIHCHEETDEVGADEPYVLVTSVNLASSVSVQGFPVPLPAFDVVRYGFDDVDDEETHFTPGMSQSFWGLNGAPAALADPQKAIFVVSLMENDDGDPEATRDRQKRRRRVCPRKPDREPPRQGQRADPRRQFRNGHTHRRTQLRRQGRCAGASVLGR